MTASPYLPLTREQALSMSRLHGEPYVHLGRGRFAQLCAAVRHEGAQKAVAYAADPQSLLVWPNYAEMLGAALTVQALLPGDHWMQGRPVDVDTFGLPEVWERLRREALGSADLTHPLNALAAQTASLLGAALEADVRHEPRTPEDVAAALDVLTVTVASVLLMTEDDVSPRSVRETVANFTVTPDATGRAQARELTARFWRPAGAVLS